MQSRITIDYMMIIGKYFMSNADYINIMKVCKMYKSLVLMYRYNPISDCRLFKNIETQHFYVYRDVFYRNRNMFQYVYWVDMFLIKNYINMIDTTKCIFKDSHINKMLKCIADLGIETINVKECITDIKKIIPEVKMTEKLYLLFEYNDICFGFKMNNNPISFPRLYNSIYFVGREIISRNVTITVSNDFLSSRVIYVRDTDFEEIMCIYIKSDKIRIEVSKKVSNKCNLPISIDIANWYLIKV